MSDKWTKIEQTEIWNPSKEGEIIEGVVESEKIGTYGRQLTIRVDKDKVIQTPSHKGLQLQLERVNPSDMLRIIYKGEVKVEKGMAKTYEVFVRDD